MKGWMAYAKHAHTYHFRRKILDDFEARFPHEISAKKPLAKNVAFIVNNLSD